MEKVLINDITLRDGEQARIQVAMEFRPKSIDCVFRNSLYLKIIFCEVA